MTPDWAAKPITVPYAKFGDPQSLNLYAYVENSPINRIDADGHVTSADFRCPDQRHCVDQSPTVGDSCDNTANDCYTGDLASDYILWLAQHPCRQTQCSVVVTSDNKQTPAPGSGNVAERNIEYQVRTAKGKNVHDVEVVLIEEFVAGKEGTGDTSGICSGNGCSNKSTPNQEDFHSGQFHDDIHVDFGSRRSFSVTQQFFVDGGQVAIQFGTSTHYSQTVEVRNDDIIIRPNPLQ
jgi:hypothetical protein